MRKLKRLLAFVLAPALANAQNANVDSLQNALARATTDSMKYEVLSGLYRFYFDGNRDSALYFAEQQWQIAKRNNKKLELANALNNKGYQLRQQGRFGASLACYLEAIKIAEDPETRKSFWTPPINVTPENARLNRLASIYHNFGHLLGATGNISQQVSYYLKAKELAEKTNNQDLTILVHMNLGSAYNRLNKLDSALNFEMIAEKMSSESNPKTTNPGILTIIGNIYTKKGEYTRAKTYFHCSMDLAREQHRFGSVVRNYFRLGRLFLLEGNPDSALFYGVKAKDGLLELGGTSGYEYTPDLVYDNIFTAYQLKGRFDSAYKYQGLALAAKDSIYKEQFENLADFQQLNLAEKMRLQELEKEKALYRGRVRTYFMVGAIGVLLILATVFYRNFRQRRRAHERITKAYAELKDTQQQLIQSEKMASLGELTAGIAHEIQNPLNFVNNFSEVNLELIEELKGIRRKAEGERDPLLEEELINDIGQNEEKIIHHGKRADAIVKGMLQHSQSSKGVKEPTDINALCDEYLRLAYHGLRAKDKNFNAALKTDFDQSIGKINIIPQDIGRVLLNLINNAFYACTERSAQPKAGSQEPGAPSKDDRDRNAVTEREELAANSYQLTVSPYVPTVSLTTKKTGNSIEIRVADNGNGIPQKILDKIFQPFFTTKPTGQGTGLGLSLSYDIVKAHGGEIKVTTKEGAGTEFVIQLPI